MTVEEIDVPQLKDGEVLVKLYAAALNHREVFIRQCQSLRLIRLISDETHTELLLLTLQPCILEYSMVGGSPCQFSQRASTDRLLLYFHSQAPYSEQMERVY